MLTLGSAANAPDLCGERDPADTHHEGDQVREMQCLAGIDQERLIETDRESERGRKRQEIPRDKDRDRDKGMAIGMDGGLRRRAVYCRPAGVRFHSVHKKKESGN